MRLWPSLERSLAERRGWRWGRRWVRGRRRWLGTGASWPPCGWPVRPQQTQLPGHRRRVPLRRRAAMLRFTQLWLRLRRAKPSACHCLDRSGPSARLVTLRPDSSTLPLSVPPRPL